MANKRAGRDAELSGSDKALGGAAEGTRTPDPLITNEVLYQLSYRGEFRLTE